jgi:hypothetical protein
MLFPATTWSRCILLLSPYAALASNARPVGRTGGLVIAWESASLPELTAGGISLNAYNRCPILGDTLPAVRHAPPARRSTDGRGGRCSLAP